MEIDTRNYASRPLKMQKNRVRRTYRGGRLLDSWQHAESFENGYKPEEWIASAVSARNIPPVENEGLSRLVTGNNEDIYLRDLIEADPCGLLGEAHFQKFGSNPAILVKAIDTVERLSIQVHPDRYHAKEFFKSDFGKTEAWYIIGSHAEMEEEPYILLGFKPGVTRETWKKMFFQQDISGMIESLHRFEVKPGDVFLIEGGVPHAIGLGCFLIELQEPTDYTLRVERTAPDGTPLPDFLCHQGLGFEKMLDCFNYEPCSREQALERWYIKPSTSVFKTDVKEVFLISPDKAKYFSMTKTEVADSYIKSQEGRFSVAIVLSGKGKLLSNGFCMELEESDELFLPAGLGELEWINQSEGQKLCILMCHPQE